MTTEQLLEPRYKVIADYPGQCYQIGDVIETYETAMCYAIGSSPHCEPVWSEKVSLKDYPSIFRRLEWWEHRSKNDLPGYLKDNADGEIFKVKEWLDNTQAVIWLNKNKKMNHTGIHQASPEHFTPATETEYTQYLNTQTEK